MADPPKKLITLKGPSVGFNGTKIVNYTKFGGGRDYFIGPGDSNSDMVSKVAEGIRHVVFNCHGYPASESQPADLQIGQTLHHGNCDVCAPWMNVRSLKVIWLSACNIGGSGLPFCKKLAEITGCYVVSNLMFALDRSVAKDTIEDNYYATPVYIDPWAQMVSRDVFIAAGGSLGFSYP